MIFALLIMFMVPAAWWSFRFQRSAAQVVHRLPADGVDLSAATQAHPAGSAASTRGQQVGAAAAGAVQQLERPFAQGCTSVLGWDDFILTSTLVFDGTVLLSCRRLPGDGERGVTKPSWRVKAGSGAARATDPGSSEDLTMVLLIGDDERAERAVSLLETWQISEVALRLRPTAVAGAIEVFDDKRRALRAPLLVA